MPNINNFTRPKGRIDAVSVYHGNVEIPVSKFDANFAFDAFSHSFSLETPIDFDPFSRDEIRVFLGEELLLTGLVYTAAPDGTVWTLSGKTLTCVLERHAVSHSATSDRWTLSEVSPLEIAQMYGKTADIEFSSSSRTAQKRISDLDVDPKTFISEVIAKICRENNLFVSANARDNTAQLRHLHSLGERLFTIDPEKDAIPFDNLIVEFNLAAMSSRYTGIAESDEEKTIFTSDREFRHATIPGIKIVRPSGNQDVEEALDAQMSKDLIDTLKISFSLPFIIFNKRVIRPYDTFHLNAVKYGIKNREFSITDISLSIEESAVRANISACLSTALSGHLTEGGNLSNDSF